MRSIQQRTLAGITEVHGQADGDPDHERHPGVPAQVSHQHDAEDHGQRRDHGHERHAERAFQVGTLLAHDDHGNRHQAERGQRADVDQLGQDVERHEGGHHAKEQAHHPGRKERRLEFRVHGRQALGQQAVARHGKDDAGLAVSHHQNHGGHAKDGAQVDKTGHPVFTGVFQGQRDRVVDAQEFLVRHDAGHDGRHDHVQHGAYAQRTDDADRQVALGTFDFFRRRRDRIETDEGKEHQRGSAQHAVVTVRHERLPVGRLHVARTDKDKQQHHADLDCHHDVVHAGRFAHAPAQHGREHQHDDQRGQVDDGGHARQRAGRGRQRHRQLVAEAGDERLEIAGPAHRHGGRGQAVFEQQVPADHPGGQLAQGGVGIGVDRTGHGHGGGEFGVTQGGKAAGNGGHHERERQRRAGSDGAGAGQHENTGADNGANTHQNQVEGTEYFGQTAGLLRAGNHIIEEDVAVATVCFVALLFRIRHSAGLDCCHFTRRMTGMAGTRSQSGKAPARAADGRTGGVGVKAGIARRAGPAAGVVAIMGVDGVEGVGGVGGIVGVIRQPPAAALAAPPAQNIARRRGRFGQRTVQYGGGLRLARGMGGRDGLAGAGQPRPAAIKPGHGARAQAQRQPQHIEQPCHDKHGAKRQRRPVFDVQFDSGQVARCLRIEMGGKRRQQLGLVFAGAGTALPALDLQADVGGHGRAVGGGRVGVGGADPRRRQGGRVALGGARRVAGVGMHGCVGQQLGKRDALVERGRFQVVARLRGLAVAALVDDQLAMALVAAQRQLVVVEIADQLVEQGVHRCRRAGGRRQVAVENGAEMFEHGAMEGGAVQAGVQAGPGGAVPVQMRVAFAVVRHGQLGQQSRHPLRALRFHEAGALRQFRDPVPGGHRASLVDVGAEHAAGQRIDQHHGLAVERKRVLQAQVTLHPRGAGRVAPGAARDQREKQRGLFIVAAQRLGQRLVGQRLVVVEPRAQRHQRRRQPVARCGQHQFLGGGRDGVLAYHAEVGCLQDADGGAAHLFVIAELALELLAHFYLAGFGQLQLLVHGVGGNEFAKQFFQRCQLVAGVGDFLAHAGHLAGHRVHIAADGAQAGFDHRQVGHVHDTLVAHAAPGRTAPARRARRAGSAWARTPGCMAQAVALEHAERLVVGAVAFDVDDVGHVAAGSGAVGAAAHDARRREPAAVLDGHDVFHRVHHQAVLFVAPFDHQDLGLLGGVGGRHAVQAAQVDHAHHLLAQVEHAAQEVGHAGRARDVAGVVDDFAHLGDFHGIGVIERKRQVHMALAAPGVARGQAGGSRIVGGIQAGVAGAHVDDFRAGQDLPVVEQDDVGLAGAGDATGKHAGARLAQQRDRHQVFRIVIDDAVHRIDQEADGGVVDAGDHHALVGRIVAHLAGGRVLGSAGREQQGAEAHDRHRAAAEIDAALAQRAVQDGRLDFGHADDFLDGAHVEGERRPRRAETHALAAFALVPPCRLPARALQRQNLRHVFDAQQRGRIEHLQQARAVVQQDGAGDHALALAGRIRQRAALLGPHAQDIAGSVEQDADQHALVVEDGDFLAAVGSRRGRVEHARQVDHRNHRAAQVEHAVEEWRRQRHHRHAVRVVDDLADALGGQGEFVVAQHERAEQLTRGSGAGLNGGSAMVDGIRHGAPRAGVAGVSQAR
uniref:Uncharacterized protein n=1 Tax=Tanacetum cinerariifolium TaxID=118510 RepID=A0A699GKN3_TANCI|nr:hypothetical protein [Tanacetum cinerariifolium]